MIRNFLFCAISVMTLWFPMNKSLANEAPTSSNTDTVKTLSVGQTAYFNLKGETKPMEITLQRIIEDSRCPRGTQCIWDGCIIIELLIDKTLIVKLSSVQRPFLYKDFEICISSALPYPKDTTEIKTENYRIDVRVTPN